MVKMKAFYILLISSLACGQDIRSQKLLHDGNNQFSSKMLSEVVKMNKNRSVVLSAFSVITPLSQLADASEGPTHDELLTALGFPDDGTNHKIFALIEAKFQSVQGIELKKASKLYIPLGYQVQDAFAALSRDVYHSEIANVDFGNSKKSSKEINTWVEQQTNNRIKNLVDPSFITRDTRGVLVNALYFKGTWQHKFKKDKTKKEDFFVSGEKSLKVQMMHSTEDYKFKESDHLKSKMLELPYKGGQASFIIVLPNDVGGLEEVVEKLKDPNILDKEISEMFEVEVEASIPKFKIETTTNLKSVLSSMDVTKIFGRDANFSKLLKSNENIYVSDAVQKAFIEINEEGAEAAAANAFVIRPTSLSYRPIRHEFVADHPFVYFLKVQDEILFSGVFYGP